MKFGKNFVEKYDYGRFVMKEDTLGILDNNYPLTLMLKKKAPGTYSHSAATAALLKQLAIALDLDEFKLTIAGLFHDIGKTVNPKVFTENQTTDEDRAFHSELPSHVSLKYITSHIGDTAQILINDPGISQLPNVIRWCTQHHGNSIVQYFYNKDKECMEDVNPDNYRYSCTRPECLEAALLMICDILEATAKSLSQANKLDVNELVERVMLNLEVDGQLDDVEFTFKKLRIIKVVLKEELAAQYHQRVDYDTEEERHEE